MIAKALGISKRDVYGGEGQKIRCYCHRTLEGGNIITLHKE